MAELNLLGFHHLTAISANIQDNKRFYTEIMGMRLVKRTVNQDDTSAYHLFYADKVATPGTDLTFFDWPMRRERRGNHSITRTGMRVRDVDNLTYWQTRFDSLGVSHGEITERDGRQVLDFEDPEGQRLALVVDGGVGSEITPWEASSVPAEHQIRGLGPITMTIPSLRETDLILQRVLNMRPVREYADPYSPAHQVHVYLMGVGDGPHTELHVAVQPTLPPVSSGAGGVHHVAFRTPTYDEYHAWTRRFEAFGLQTSGEIDRYYFRSLYYREPNGILFEIATDGPGFAVDEDPAHLGEKVILPPRFEAQRDRILQGLKPLD